jgi:hypothetical protein
VHWVAAPPDSPDVIINISADNTAAFSAWAMGNCASRCSIGDLTGVLPSLLLSSNAFNDCQLLSSCKGELRAAKD